MELKKSNHLPVCIICGILSAFGVAASIISLFNSTNSTTLINDIIDLLLSVFIGYYAVWGYHKPHGNLLKYIILVFTIPFLVSVCSRAQHGAALQAVTRTVTVGLLCYIAGRLHKVKQNIVLMSIVTVLIIISKVVKVVNGKTAVSTFSSLIIWGNICVAYFLRYKDHKLAGLMDKE